jgi:hypothetical protein
MPLVAAARPGPAGRPGPQGVHGHLRAGEQIAHARLVEKDPPRRDRDRGIDGRGPGQGGFGLGAGEPGGFGQELAVQVRFLERVAVGRDDRAHTRAGQYLEHGPAKAAEAHQGRRGAEQLGLLGQGIGGEVAQIPGRNDPQARAARSTSPSGRACCRAMSAASRAVKDSDRRAVGQGRVHGPGGDGRVRVHVSRR